MSEREKWISAAYDVYDGYTTSDRLGAIYDAGLAAREQEGGEVVAWDNPAVDPIVTKLYRRFKEWSQRGFTADDVTWCEVRKEVADMLNATAHPGASVPDGYVLVEKVITPVHVVEAGVNCLSALKAANVVEPRTVAALVFQDMLLAYEKGEGNG